MNLEFPIFGWYMLTPTDLNKQKQKTTLRWVMINDYWLEISSKPGEPPLITIHLNFLKFRPPNNNEPLPINSLILTTNSFFGDWELVLSTNNRFEILDLNKALFKGQENWNKLMETGPNQLTFESSFKDKNIGFLGGKNVECNLSIEGFKTIRSQSESNLYLFENIKLIRPVRFDTRQGSCFEMQVIQQNLKPELLFQCHDHLEMKKFLTIFYYFLTLNQIEKN